LLHESLAIQLLILKLFFNTISNVYFSVHVCEDKVIAVTRSLRTRNIVQTTEHLHGENGDVEVRRSCRIRSRYSTVNQSVLFDKLITK
jgi:hypothetical protein